VSRLTQKITLTDVEAGSVVTSFTTPAKTLTFDARGRMVYVGCEGGDVLVYDARMAAKEGAVSRIAKAHPQRVRGLAITSAKGDETVGDSGPSALVTAGSEGVVRAWDLRRASGPRDENPGTPVAEINSGARYTCLCAMPAETVPDAPKPKLPAPKPRADAPAKKQADKSSKVSTSKDNKPASSKRHDMKQKKRPDIGGDDDFEVVPEEHEPAAKREPSRFDSDSDGDAPYAKPAGGKKRQKQRQGPAYEKTATSARRKANNIKHKKRR
jgi:protein MAK11